MRGILTLEKESGKYFTNILLSVWLVFESRLTPYRWVTNSTKKTNNDMVDASL